MNKKEEILLSIDDGFIVQPEISDIVERSNALKAMDIFAKQDAISFLQWVIIEGYEVHSKDAFMKIDNKGFDDIGVAKILSATNLYELYTKEQSIT